MPFDCGSSTIEAEGHFGGAARTVKCNRWKCPICQPARQRRLVALGMSGQPTAFITLTSRRRPGMTREQAADELLSAFALFVLRFRREQKKPPGSRYIPSGPLTFQHRRQQVVKIAQREDKAQTEVAEYLWVMEATKNGWPHLHILWRGRYVPQWWLADQMEALTGSRVCWIERIKNPKKQAAYVAKYCGKAPHQFGSHNRYHKSKNYPNPDQPKWERTLPSCWKWNMRDVSISVIKQEWGRYGRAFYDIDPDTIAWGVLHEPDMQSRAPPGYRFIVNEGVGKFILDKRKQQGVAGSAQRV